MPQRLLPQLLPPGRKKLKVRVVKRKTRRPLNSGSRRENINNSASPINRKNRREPEWKVFSVPDDAHLKTKMFDAHGRGMCICPIATIVFF
jgi:hypothetical protein